MKNVFYLLNKINRIAVYGFVIQKDKRVKIQSEGDYYFIEFDGFTYCTKGNKAAFKLLALVKNPCRIEKSGRYKRITIKSEGNYFFIEIDGLMYCTEGIKAAFVLLKAIKK